MEEGLVSNRHRCSSDQRTLASAPSSLSGNCVAPTVELRFRQYKSPLAVFFRRQDACFLSGAEWAGSTRKPLREALATAATGHIQAKVFCKHTQSVSVLSATSSGYMQHLSLSLPLLSLPESYSGLSAIFFVGLFEGRVSSWGLDCPH